MYIYICVYKGGRGGGGRVRWGAVKWQIVICKHLKLRVLWGRRSAAAVSMPTRAQRRLPP